MNGRTSAWMLALAVATITVWIHWPCLQNGFLNWDDDIYLEAVAHHPQLDGETLAWAFTTTVPFYYHPLTLLSHVADYQLWGMDPWGHHLSNLLLHGLNTGLVLMFVWLLLEYAGLSGGQRLALAGGVSLVFGLHPAQVEPVAWVAERKTLLCTLFSLLSLCAYWKAVAEPPAGVTSSTFGGQAAAPAKRNWWRAMIVLFVAALMAKPMALSLPVVMLSMDFYPLRRETTVGWRGLLREKALLFGFCVVDFVLTVIGQSAMGAVMTMRAQNPVERILVAGRALIFYLWKLAWPAWLCPFYPLGGAVSLSQAEFWVPLALVAAITGLVVWLGKRARGLLAAWCAYVALLVPVSGLSQVGMQAVGDRFMYQAMLPPLLVLGWGAVWLWQHLRTAGRCALLLALYGEMGFLVVRTRQQIPVWRNSETMWNAVLDHFPRSGIAQGQLALALASQRRFEEALPHAQAALADIPEYPVAREALGTICSGLAVERLQQRQFAEALPYVDQMLHLNPTNGSVHAMIGLIRLKTGQPGQAISELREALRLNPDLPSARYNLACACSRMGRFAEAYETLQSLLSSQPRFAQLAARDTEFSDLRTNTAYQAQFQALISRGEPPQ